MKYLRVTLMLACCLQYTAFAADDAGYRESSEPIYTVGEVQEDLAELLTFVRSTHPDLAYSANMGDLASMEALIHEKVAQPLSQAEVWALFARFNPVFADAHVGVRRLVDAVAQFEEGGGLLLPIPVVLERDATPRLGLVAHGPLSEYTGAKILSINNYSMADHVATLLPRMRGETEVLRLKVMALYFAEYYWLLRGGTYEYALVLEKDGKAHQITVTERCCDIAGAEPEEFAYRTLMSGTGYLRVDTFDITKKDAFAAFLPNAFAAMAKDDVETLVIDLRENTGGAADTSDLLMAYLTGKTYSSISAVKARVVAQNVARIPNSRIGDVVELPFRLNVTPPADLEHRFRGKVVILIGTLTYSQAIVFAATAKDHGIATLAGVPTEGAANQTGQVQFHRLANTGIEVMAPLYIFTRASGEKGRAPLRPDIELDENLVAPEAFIEDLLVRMP